MGHIGAQQTRLMPYLLWRHFFSKSSTPRRPPSWGCHGHSQSSRRTHRVRAISLFVVCSQAVGQGVWQRFGAAVYGRARRTLVPQC